MVVVCSALAGSFAIPTFLARRQVHLRRAPDPAEVGLRATAPVRAGR